MSTSSQPTLIPSICFFIPYTSMALLHLWKFIKRKRAIYIYLFIFSLLRTCLFIFRIAWAPNPDSTVLGVVSNILLSGAFFVVMEAMVVLFSDWLLILSENKTISSLPNFEYYSIRLFEFILPVFSIIGATGEIFKFDAKTTSKMLASSLIQTSSLGFLCLIIIYIILVTHVALKYGEKIRKQLRALVLYISAALLLIELVYRTFVSFSHESSPIYDYEWVFYVFECVPEIVLLMILGGIILDEWFFNNNIEDSDELKSVQQSQTIGVYLLNRNNLPRRGETTGEGEATREESRQGGILTKQSETNSIAESRADSKTIIINDDKSERTNNTSNTTNSSV